MSEFKTINTVGRNHTPVTMKTLQEDIDDLDRMIDGGAAKDAVRSQIRLISREVAALQADYARLAETHTNLREAHSILDAQHSKLTNAQSDANYNALLKEEDNCRKAIQNSLLNHNG